MQQQSQNFIMDQSIAQVMDYDPPQQKSQAQRRARIIQTAQRGAGKWVMREFVRMGIRLWNFKDQELYKELPQPAESFAIWLADPANNTPDVSGAYLAMQVYDSVMRYFGLTARAEPILRVGWGKYQMIMPIIEELRAECELLHALVLRYDQTVQKLIAHEGLRGKEESPRVVDLRAKAAQTSWEYVGKFRSNRAKVADWLRLAAELPKSKLKDEIYSDEPEQWETFLSTPIPIRALLKLETQADWIRFLGLEGVNLDRTVVIDVKGKVGNW